MGGGLWRWSFGAGAIAALFSACGGTVEIGDGGTSGGSAGTRGSTTTGGAGGKGGSGGHGGSSSATGGSGGGEVGGSVSGGVGGSVSGGVGGTGGIATGGSAGSFDAGTYVCEACAIANCGTEYAACTGSCASETSCIQNYVLRNVASGTVVDFKIIAMFEEDCAIGGTITPQTNDLITCLSWGIHPDGGWGSGCLNVCF